MYGSISCDLNEANDVDVVDNGSGEEGNHTVLQCDVTAAHHVCGLQ